MYKQRELFLKKQMDLYADIIDDLEHSKINQKEKKDLLNIKDLYDKYEGEYKDLQMQKTEENSTESVLSPVKSL